MRGLQLQLFFITLVLLSTAGASWPWFVLALAVYAVATA